MKPKRYPYQNRVHKHDAKVIINQFGYRVECRYCKKIFLEVITKEVTNED